MNMIKKQAGKLNSFRLQTKLDQSKRTGSEGSSKTTFTECDNIVFDIIGERTPVMEGLDVADVFTQQDMEAVLGDDEVNVLDFILLQFIVLR